MSCSSSECACRVYVLILIEFAPRTDFRPAGYRSKQGTVTGTHAHTVEWVRGSPVEVPLTAATPVKRPTAQAPYAAAWALFYSMSTLAMGVPRNPQHRSTFGLGTRWHDALGPAPRPNSRSTDSAGGPLRT